MLDPGYILQQTCSTYQQRARTRRRNTEASRHYQSAHSTLLLGVHHISKVSAYGWRACALSLDIQTVILRFGQHQAGTAGACSLATS